ncbi:MAG: hypothetical protein JWM11_6465 [Planctomycetaceae bacterium]|nr:hypothetical protein [Planctomycetaceae bacterium]
MFRAFDLQGFDESFFASFQNTEGLVKYGRYMTASGKKAVTEALTEIASDKSVLDGQTIQDSWFPDVEADVMLSHSHGDEDEVLMLAGWLKSKFGLTSFVDSSIWGYAGDLLRMIDDKYCRNANGETYNYALRNESTSHVHMLLTTALGKMIHKTECLIFINTPASIATRQVVKTQTFSPWIFAELTLAGIVEEVIPKRLVTDDGWVTANKSAGILKEAEVRRLRVLHTVENMSRFTAIDGETLSTWYNECEDKGPESLDKLYEVTTR